MKKSDEDNVLKKERGKKKNLKMKFCFFMTSLMLFQLSANSVMSQKKIEFNYNSVPLKHILNEIKSQTGYRFFYNVKEIDVEQKISLKVDGENVREVLNKLAVKANFDFKVNENQIVLTQKKTTSHQFQEIEIKGVVTDENGARLPGASIVEKGTTNGTQTDFDGNFSLELANESAVLVISYIGFATKEVDIIGQSTINVMLEQSAAGLDEVVVVGYGSVKKSDLTGSVSQVKTETLEVVPVYNMEEALKVGATGVRVSQNSGTPGSRTEVRIRGGNSLMGGNEPLYVVDGFPIVGGIDFLNPSDIESVDILKDASATAIYGSRGANGVVIITSKRGKIGQEGKIEVNSYYGLQQTIGQYDLLNAKEYAVIANAWLKDKGLAPYFNVAEVENPGTNWQDAIFRTAPISTNTITFSGGSEKGRYSVSGNYFDQDGIIQNSGAQRGSLRVNLDQEVKSWLKLGVNLQLSRNLVNSVPVDNGAKGGQSILSGAASAPPTLPLYNEDGTPTQIEQAYSFGSIDMRNPLIYTSRKNQTLTNSILVNTTFDITFSPYLSFRTLLGLQYDYGKNETFTPVIYENDRGSASERNDYSNSFLNENILTYSKLFNEKHNVNVIGGITYQKNMDRSSRIGVSGFSNNITENYDLGAAESVDNPTSNYSEWSLVSFLTRVNYSFDNKYLITASIRADGSSRFGTDNKWGYFPAGALAWRVSEESFLKDNKVISDLKLRASYGLTGNTAVSPYQSLDRLYSVKYVYANQKESIGFVPTGIANSNLKWETTTQMDLGFDLNLFRDRIRFVFDYYVKHTNDLLASVPLPPSVGFGTILRNVGEIQNKGVELGINVDIINNEEFQWNVSAQFSANKNKVIALNGGSDIFSAGQDAAWPSSNIAREGYPLGMFYGLLEDGLDDQGFIKYQDISGPDGVPDGVINALDRVILGNPNPDFIYGFTSNFKYKGIELNIQIDGVQGIELFNTTNGTQLNSFQRGQNQFKDLIGNYWTEEDPNPDAKYPRISSSSQFTVSDRFIEDASYLRIRSLKLAYNFIGSQLGMPGLDMAQLYISGSNLFTFTNYAGLDPEANTRGADSGGIGDRLMIGWDQSAYPRAKIYAIGLKFQF